MVWAGLIPALVVSVVDQASKWWIFLDVMNPPRVLEITPFFNVVLTFNRGVSFGLLASDSPWGQPLLIALALAISIFLILWLRKAESVLAARAIGLTLGGALGNVIDRFVHGGVVDFLDFSAFGMHWPAFNVADAAITCGVALLLFDALITERGNHK